MPEGDFEHLFALDGHGGARGANLGDMDDPEPDPRLDGVGAASQSVTYGELLRKSI